MGNTPPPPPPPPPPPQGTMYVKRRTIVARKLCPSLQDDFAENGTFSVKVLVKMSVIFYAEGHNCSSMIPSCTKPRDLVHVDLYVL
jgi:hypothetical protein